MKIIIGAVMVIASQFFLFSIPYSLIKIAIGETLLIIGLFLVAELAQRPNMEKWK